jgi:holo-ACP synthase
MTLNLPGPDKGLPRWLEFYGAVRADLQRTLRDEGFDFFHVPDVPHFFHKFGQLSAAGPEDHFLFRGLASGEELKRRAADFEERHPGGRLVDLDVMVRGEPIGREALGLPPRPCFCCPRPARECAGSARHPLNEVLEAAERILEAALSL